MPVTPLGMLGNEPWLLQGWFPARAEALACAMAQGGAMGVLRVPAFPDLAELEARLEVAGRVGLDIKGQLGHFAEVIALAVREKLPFLTHGVHLKPELKERLRTCGIFRMAFVQDSGEASLAAQDGADALVVASGPDHAERLAEIRAATGLPLLAEAGHDPAEARALLDVDGVAGLQLRSPTLLRQLSPTLKGLQADVAGDDVPPLPTLKIRNLEFPHPVIQGGMGVGVSWENLAGAAAQNGCLGIVSAIGTGYRHPDVVESRDGRPLGPDNLNNDEALGRIIREAIHRSGGHGAVGVNILCAINGYEHVVRASVAAGAKVIISGAGLPLNLPEYVGDADVALVPIVSSARALSVICKSWERKFKRLPDAVVLEGPESGGHQGFSVEQCVDPNYSLENLLPSVIEERDKWGDFPVIAAGGVWDRADIDRLLAMGASGVQMATRFIGTLECDASLTFKEVLLQADREDIQLVKSPVGMPGRAVQTQLQRDIAVGSAPPVRCTSDCVAPCGHGKGAVTVGYCIADRLGDARNGLQETGLFFTGSNGWKLKELVSVRELVAEITQDFR